MSNTLDVTGGSSATSEVKMYAVFRSGIRVSDSEYDSKLSARSEYEYWQKLLKRWPDGTKMDIRELNYRRRSYAPQQ